MQLRISLVLLLLLLGFTCSIEAQDAKNPEEKAAKLRQQLSELQAKEAEMRVRLQQLDEDLKPENIERSLAGIGSTKPEELREHRRRMLIIEKNGLLAQLKSLEESRSRLEAAIANADAQIYMQYAQPSPATSSQMLMAQNTQGSRWLWLIIVPAVLIVVLILGAVTLVMARRAS